MHPRLMALSLVIRFFRAPTYVDTLGREHFQLDMIFDVCKTISTCKSSSRNRRNEHYRRHFNLYSAMGASEFVAMNNLSPLSKTTKESQHVVSITDRSLANMQAAPTVWTATSTMAEIFSRARVIPCSILAYVLADNGSQHVGKFSESICNHLGTKHHTRAAYHSQTNG